MNAAPSPAVMPSRRKAEPLHCLRLRVDGYTYVAAEASPELVRQQRDDLIDDVVIGDARFVRLPLIDGREVDVPVAAIVGIETGPMPTAVRRALVRDGVLSPLGDSLVGPTTEQALAGRVRPGLGL